MDGYGQSSVIGSKIERGTSRARESDLISGWVSLWGRFWRNAGLWTTDVNEMLVLCKVSFEKCPYGCVLVPRVHSIEIITGRECVQRRRSTRPAYLLDFERGQKPSYLCRWLDKGGRPFLVTVSGWELDCGENVMRLDWVCVWTSSLEVIEEDKMTLGR